MTISREGQVRMWQHIYLINIKIDMSVHFSYIYLELSVYISIYLSSRLSI